MAAYLYSFDIDINPLESRAKHVQERSIVGRKLSATIVRELIGVQICGITPFMNIDSKYKSSFTQKYPFLQISRNMKNWCLSMQMPVLSI